MSLRAAFHHGLAALCVLAAAAHAQVLTTVKALQQLDPRIAADQPRAVKLRGTVLMSAVLEKGFTLHDGEMGIPVFLVPGVECPGTGDVVEVTGTTMSYEWGVTKRARIQAAEVKVITTGAKLPAPKSVALSEVVVTRHLDQWVSVEGQVLEWVYDGGQLTLVIVTKDAISSVVVRTRDAAALLDSLSGAVLRITGVNAPFGTATTSLCSPGMEQVEVIEPGLKSLFDAPEASLAQVLERTVPAGRLMRTRGVVVGKVTSNRFIISSPEAADGAMIVDLRPPRGAGAPTSRYGQPMQWPVMEKGDMIEVVGVVMNTTDTSGTGLTMCFARHQGKAPPPAPVMVPLDQLAAAHPRDQWTTVQGVVSGWSWQGDNMLYSVLSTKTKIIIGTRATPGMTFPNDLHGAVVQFTGLWFGGAHLPREPAFVVPDLTHVEVVRPGTRDPFAVHEKPVEQILAESAPAAMRVKTRGVVLGLTDGPLLHLRGAQSAITASVQLPWARPKGSRSMQFADGGALPTLHPGDLVEVIGSPVRSVARPEMQECDLIEVQVRVTGKALSLTPTDATVEAIEHGEHNSDLVRVRGRLLTLQQLPGSTGKWRTTMMVESGGKSLPVIHESTRRTSFETIKPDDEVLLTGLVKRATSAQPSHVRLADAGDVKSLGLATAIVRQRVWMWGSAAAAVLLLLGAWIIALNRSVRYRTRELRATQVRLEQALQQERQLGEMKSRFVSMVSHEFRTPLGVVMSAGDVLHRYFDRLDPEKREKHLDMILRGSRQLADIMDEVLLLSRVEEGRVLFKPGPLDLAGLCRTLVDELRSATRDVCPIEFNLRGDLGGAVSDESLLRHILGNLISNAVKYSEPGRPVSVTVQRDGADAVFAVQDQGIGIP